MKIDKKIIKELSDYLDEFNLTELEYTEKDTKIKVSKNNVSISNQSNNNKNINPSLEIQKKLIILNQVLRLNHQLLEQLITLQSLELKNLLKLEKRSKKVIR